MYWRHTFKLKIFYEKSYPNRNLRCCKGKPKGIKDLTAERRTLRKPRFPFHFRSSTFMYIFNNDYKSRLGLL